jgi:ATP-binding cassette subfamily B protein
MLDKVALLTRENLQGSRVIRAFSRQAGQKAKFGAQSDDMLAAQKRLSIISALLNPITYLIVNCGIIAILWFGGLAVDGGALEQGQIVALINYMTR